MNAWQKRFAQKLDKVRMGAQERFEDMAERLVLPVFRETASFTDEHGLNAATPLAKPGVRTFKFSLTENAYLLMTFRSTGFDRCELLSEFAVPHHPKIPPIQVSEHLSSVDEKWAHRLFEQSLDQLVDAMVETYSAAVDERTEELAGA